MWPPSGCPSRLPRADSGAKTSLGRGCRASRSRCVALWRSRAFRVRTQPARRGAPLTWGGFRDGASSGYLSHLVKEAIGGVASRACPPKGVSNREWRFRQKILKFSQESSYPRDYNEVVPHRDLGGLPTDRRNGFFTCEPCASHVLATSPPRRHGGGAPGGSLDRMYPGRLRHATRRPERAHHASPRGAWYTWRRSSWGPSRI